jgi:phage FluMu protein Com
MKLDSDGKFPEISCRKCGKMFVPSYQTVKNCPNCRVVHQKAPESAICSRCGNEFKPVRYWQVICKTCSLPRYITDSSYTGMTGRYQSGELNNNWKGGVTKFREIKLSSMEKFNCEYCGKDLTEIIADPEMTNLWCVHHEDGDHANNDVSNLTLLCKSCHQLNHSCVDSSGRFTKLKV